MSRIAAPAPAETTTTEAIVLPFRRRALSIRADIVLPRPNEQSYYSCMRTEIAEVRNLGVHISPQTPGGRRRLAEASFKQLESRLNTADLCATELAEQNKQRDARITALEEIAVAA